MSKYFSLHIEFMRIIACYFVIFNHTGNQGYFLFSLYSPDCISYWICLFFSIFCKFAVPLFLCISGTLLLKNTKNESIFYVMKHRIFRFVIVLISFSFFYYLVEIFINNPQKFNIITFFYVLINKDWNYSYWYLYLLIAFLLTLPILCKLRKNLTNIHYIYCFSLYIFFVPIVLLFSFFLDININNLLIPNFFTSIIIIYPLLGDFIERIFKMEINTHVLIKMWLVNIFFIVVSSILTYYRAVIYTGGYAVRRNRNTFIIRLL